MEIMYVCRWTSQFDMSELIVVHASTRQKMSSRPLPK
jgi:hypothetical protein